MSALKGGALATLWEMIERHDVAIDHENVTKAILDELAAMPKAELREVLFQIVFDEVRRRRRGGVRALESVGTAAHPADPNKTRRDLLDQRFFVSPDRGYVLWGEATVDDHLTRAAYLRHMAGGLVGTAEKHEQTANLLRARGAICLYELERVPA